jgi:cytochrome c5
VKLLKTLAQSFLLVGLLVGSAIADDQVADDVKSRIAPVGNTCMSGDDCAAAPVAVASGPKSGKEVYESFCTTCHNTGVLNAPKLGAAADWAPRVAKGKDTLYTHAISGFNSMPAKGMCSACSDDEIKGAVDYMTSNSK